MVDYETFKTECLTVSQDEDKFSTFKRNRKITYMLEQTEPRSTAEYFTRRFEQVLVEKYRDILSTLPWDDLTANDRIGNPLLFPTPTLPGVEKSSHTTLRYVLYALDVWSSLKHRGFDKKTINAVEVGCGYGGQAVTLSTILKWDGITVDYTVIDLPEVLALTRKYLSYPLTRYSGQIAAVDMSDIDRLSPDLFLSFFSLGEMPEQYQNIYIQKLVKKSKYGHIVWNHRSLNPLLEVMRPLDVDEINPRFDRYVTVLKWPKIVEPSINLELPYDLPFVHDYVSLMKDNTHHLQALTQIVVKSGEMLEENIMTKHFNPSITANLRQVDLYILSRLSSNILNIGFNAGHSTLIMLLSNEKANIACVDTCEHSYTQECFEYLNEQFPGRLRLLRGESKSVINKTNCPLEFDMTNINGSHASNIMNLDFWNSKTVCTSNAYVIWNNLDFYSCLPLWHGFVANKQVNHFTLLSSEHLLGQYAI